MGSCNTCISDEYSPWGKSEDSLDTIQMTKLKLIGVGAFGRVWAATLDKYENSKMTYHDDKDNQTVYAIKEMNKSIIAAQNAIDIANNEVKLLQIIPKSNFIINLWHAFQNKVSAFVLMDYAPCGDLLFHMKNIKKNNQIKGIKGGTFNENQCKFISVCILEALRVVHKAGIVHRDIKPDNIIVDSNGYIKLADFGVAEMASNIKEGSQFGTLSYMAPEIIFGHKYSITADYYSLGVLLLLMSTGDMLSVGKTIKEAKQNIALRRDNLTTSRFTKRYPDISEDLCDLIVKLITTSQYQRIGQNGGVDEILEHQWFCDIDISKIQSQALESPIFDIVTKEENILKLTEVTPDKYTQYWDNKEKKARKVLNKSHIDFGQNFINEFHEFIPVNVIEADTEGKHRDSMMIIRNHTMSSIRKQREASLFEENSVSADGYESPLENPISLSGKDSVSLISKELNSPIINEGEAQSGIVS